MGKKSELKIGILYLGLHNQLCKKYGVNNTITRKDFFTKLGKHYMIPKNLRHCVVKEMEMRKLIKLIDRDNIEILHCDIDIETDINKIYHMAGLRSMK